MKQLSTFLNFILVCTLVCILVMLGLPDRTVKATQYTAAADSCDSSRSVHVSGTAVVNVTPNLFVNLGDQSALLQLVVQWDLAQNWQLLGSLNAPVGSSGTEYGGLETGVDNLTLEVGPSLFAQLAWYF